MARGVNVTVDVEDGLEMPAEIEQLVFRTAQEAIRNAGAHAAARNVTVRVTQTGDTVSLRVDRRRPGVRRRATCRPAAPGGTWALHCSETWPRLRVAR